MSLFNCKISLHSKFSKEYFLSAGTAANQGEKFTISDAKLYKYKTSNEAQNRYLDFQLIQVFKE